jgi:bifunctional UDP-N-acetylglucosamine pyrophosphorylase/glucosamine-1-phosphate N-acetyltransferase
MQAVILAAGRGTRMGPLTENTPKPMVLILGKPLLEWKLNALPKSITEVIVTIGYLGEQIKEYFGTEWQGKKITYVEQTVLNGTGGSIHAVKEFLEEFFLVTMGDDLYVEEDLERLMELPYGILGLHTKEAAQFGILEVNEKNELLKVTERPHGYTEGFINTGGYMLQKDFFSAALVPITEIEFGLPQTLATLSGKITIPVITCTAWQPVGCPEDIPKADEFIKKYYL